MNIPTPDQIKMPMLEILANEQIWERMGIVRTLASDFKLTESDLLQGFKGRTAKTISEGQFYHYCSRAMENLEHEEKFIEKVESRPGRWKITALGKQHVKIPGDS